MLENTGGWSKEKPLAKAKWYEVLVVIIIIISFFAVAFVVVVVDVTVTYCNGVFTLWQ